MAVPKSKLSSARKNSRRSSVWKMSAPTLVHCPKCGSCGFYNGREVIKKEA